MAWDSGRERSNRALSVSGGPGAARRGLSRASALDGEDAVLRAILEGTSQETGARFFASLVRNLAALFGTHAAWVTEVIEESGELRALAFWAGGRWIEGYRYPVNGTPCEAVIREGRFVHIPERVVDHFPGDQDLRSMGAVSYAGAPLTDGKGKVLGHLAVIGTRPMPERPRAMTIFRIFAARASAELMRLRAEREVLEREEKLRRLVNSAMDGVIELDACFRVTSINPAARSLFGCAEEKMLGTAFTDFLEQADRLKLQTLAGDLDRRPEGSQHLWVPGGFAALRCRGDPFRAEATLSRFQMRGRTFYALILRNVDERIEAEDRIHALTMGTEYLLEEIRSLEHFDAIIGQSAPLLRVLGDVAQVAETDATVLILGETGTGKELIARRIHDAGRRKEKPFVKVNCPAIPPPLIESEFFGHEKGAFTGATRKREGRFTLADGGTLFLDEIAELPTDLQVKLLRVLQEGEFEPVGSSRTRKVDVRVIAATNIDLRQAVEAGRFREDLYYRLNVFPIVVPPLRDRGEDILLLADAYARRFAKAMGREVHPLSEAEARRLQTYPWPGNVRELQNVIERAVITSRNGRLNLERSLPETFFPNGHGTREGSCPPGEDRVLTLKEMQEMERSNLLRALEQARWRIAGSRGAAMLLGIPPSTLNSRMKALGIIRPR